MTECRVTVAVCTRNRAPVLRRCLLAMAALTGRDTTPWELLVIDNGSTDETPIVAGHAAGSLPLRVVCEETAGLSHARNRAVREAAGAYMLWTDDDALVDPGWLAAYCAAFDRWPEAAVFGGPIEPVIEGTPPPWVTPVWPRIAPVYGARDLGADPVALTVEGDLLPFGGNFATRTDQQRRCLFDTSLGRHPEYPGRGSEETAVVTSLLRGGCRGRWVPRARVRHVVPASRLTTRFLRDHWEAYGEFRAVGEARDGDAAPLWRLQLHAIAAAARYRVARALRPPERWIPALIEAGESAGYARGRRSRVAGSRR